MASTVAVLTPWATGTGWYGLYWTLSMAAFTLATGSPSRADSSSTIPGWASCAPGRTLTTCSMRLPASNTPSRSKISPRGAGR